MTTDKETKLSLDQEGGEKMTIVRCPECSVNNDKVTPTSRGKYDYREDRIVVLCYRGSDAQGSHQMVDLEGTIICSYDGHRRPIKLISNVIDSTQPNLPVHDSVNLKPNIPDGLRQDVEEAERAHFAQCYKAACTMCRRAIQLALEGKVTPIPASGRTLGPYLAGARAMSPPLLSQQTDGLAETVKDYGDTGAHKKTAITGKEAEIMVYATVKVLNELFPK